MSYTGYCVTLLGHEEDDYRLMASNEEGSGLELNNGGLYPSVCVELIVDGLAVTTVLQASHVNDYEGSSSTSISFDYAPQVSEYGHGSFISECGARLHWRS